MTDKQDNILIIKLSALGDFIQSLGAMAAIRKHHPAAKLHLQSTKPFEKFAKECGYFDEVIIDNRPKTLDIAGWFKLAKTLRSYNFTRVYDLQNNDRVKLYYHLFATPKPQWIGHLPHGSHFNPAAKAKEIHAFDRNALSLDLVGIKNVEIDTLAWMQSDITRFPLTKPYILLVPGCAPTRPEKRWPADNYAQIATALSQQGFQPVIIGTNDEKEATDTIANACPSALNLTGQTNLYDIVTLARTSAGAIGNDTGPMHMIGATGTPCLVLFSAFSNPIKHAPKGNKVAVIQHAPLDELSVDTVLSKFTDITSN